MPKNVTGGIVLLLAGAALIGLAGSDKGRFIMDVIAGNVTLPGQSSSGSSSGSASGGGSSGSGSGFGGFGSPASGSGSGAKTVSDYQKVLYPGAFVGEKGATPL